MFASKTRRGIFHHRIRRKAMVRIGIIGIGFMGMIHYYGAKKVSGGEVVAICTRDQKKLDGDWTSIQGNFGPRGGIEDLSHLRKYNQIEELLADPDIDMVNICLPTYMHQSVSIAALQAGKHVLVEKPIEIRLDAANEVVQVGVESGKYFMVAHVLPFFAEFAYAKGAVESGEYGTITRWAFQAGNLSADMDARFRRYRKEWWTRESTCISTIRISFSCSVVSPMRSSRKANSPPVILSNISQRSTSTTTKISRSVVHQGRYLSRDEHFRTALNSIWKKRRCCMTSQRWAVNLSPQPR